LNLGIVSYKHSRTPLIRELVFRIANYPDRLCPSGKFVENSIKINCIKITGYRIKYSTVLWLLEFQIRRGRKVRRQVRTVNSNSRTANCQCSSFSKKNPIIQMDLYRIDYYNKVCHSFLVLLKQLLRFE